MEGWLARPPAPRTARGRPRSPDRREGTTWSCGRAVATVTRARPRAACSWSSHGWPRASDRESKGARAGREQRVKALGVFAVRAGVRDEKVDRRLLVHIGHSAGYRTRCRRRRAGPRWPPRWTSTGSGGTRPMCRRPYISAAWRRSRTPQHGRPGGRSRGQPPGGAGAAARASLTVCEARNYANVSRNTLGRFSPQLASRHPAFSGVPWPCRGRHGMVTRDQSRPQSRCYGDGSL